jgi:hypothetical protein
MKKFANKRKSEAANIPKSVPTDIPKSVPTDILKSVPTDIAKGESTDIPKSVPTDIAKSVPTDIAKGESTIIHKDKKTSLSGNLLSISQLVPFLTPKAAPITLEAAPEAASEDAPEDAPEAASKVALAFSFRQFYLDIDIMIFCRKFLAFFGAKELSITIDGLYLLLSQLVSQIVAISQQTVFELKDTLYYRIIKVIGGVSFDVTYLQLLIAFRNFIIHTETGDYNYKITAFTNLSIEHDVLRYEMVNEPGKVISLPKTSFLTNIHSIFILLLNKAVEIDNKFMPTLAVFTSKAARNYRKYLIEICEKRGIAFAGTNKLIQSIIHGESMAFDEAEEKILELVHIINGQNPFFRSKFKFKQF